MSPSKKLIFDLSLLIIASLVAGIFALGSLQDSPIIWVWSGGITTNSATIKTRLGAGISKAKLSVTLDSGQDGEIDQIKQASSRGIVTFRIEGLQPNSRYIYSVSTESDEALSGNFHTFAAGPMSFRIGFASCATTGSNHRIFETLREMDLDLFFHMGDFHYENIGENDVSRFYRAFDDVLTSPRQGAFFRSTPVVYVWDDHDFGKNNSDRTSPSKPAALQAYQGCVPHYPLVEADGEVRSIQQALTVGRVRFIFTDPRAMRSPADDPDGPAKTMLGIAQREWLVSEFRQARERYPLTVWVNGVPWITRSDPETDEGWEPYSYERTLIADEIEELGLTNRLIMLSGDAHMAAIDDGTHSNYTSDGDPGEYAFPVIHAAPLDRYPRIKGGPYSHGVSAPNRWLYLYKAKQFGLMEVDDDGQRLRVVLSCHNSSGQLLGNLRLELECDNTGCRILD